MFGVKAAGVLAGLERAASSDACLRQPGTQHRTKRYIGAWGAFGARGIWGSMLCLFLCLGSFAAPANAQRNMPSEELLYQVARGMAGEQSPMFLFSGFDVFSTSVLLREDVAVIAYENLTLPQGPDLGSRVLIELQPIGFGLLEVKKTTLPPVTRGAGGQTITMTGPSGDGPEFRGLWDLERNGFFSFSLDLGDVTFEGEGIEYSIPNLVFSLVDNDGRAALGFYADTWTATYEGSLGGSDSAQGVSFEISAPSADVAPAELLTLANRLMSFVLDIETPQLSQLFDSPIAENLAGLEVRIEIDAAQWATNSPPAVGGFENFSLQLGVEAQDSGPRTNPNSRMDLRVNADNFALDLADNQVSFDGPSGVEVNLAGVPALALAVALYGLEPQEAGISEEDAALATASMAADVSFFGEQMVLAMPSLSVDGTLSKIRGGARLGTAESLAAFVTSAQGDDVVDAEDDREGSIVQLYGQIEELNFPTWTGMEEMEPMASNLIVPAMPDLANLDISLSGLETDRVARILNAVASVDIGGLMDALPTDFSKFRINIDEMSLKSELLDMGVTGDFNLSGGGRVPLRGQVTLESAPFTAAVLAIQRSLGTPNQSIKRYMSAAVVGATLVQGLAKPAPGGRLLFELDFAGGLPTINGRPLPGLRMLGL